MSDHIAAVPASTPGRAVGGVGVGGEGGGGGGGEGAEGAAAALAREFSWGGLIRMVIFYYFVSTAIRSFFSPSTNNNSTQIVTTTPSGELITLTHTGPIRPGWSDHELFDIYVYINEYDEKWDVEQLYTFSATETDNKAAKRKARKKQKELNEKAETIAIADGDLTVTSTNPQIETLLSYLSTHLVWVERRISYDFAADVERVSNITITDPFLSLLKGNQSLYAHIYVTKHLFPHTPALSNNIVPDSLSSALSSYFPPATRSYHPLYSVHHTQQLNVHKKKPKEDTRKNLITGNRADGKNETEVAKEKEEMEEERLKLLALHSPEEKEIQTSLEDEEIELEEDSITHTTSTTATSTGTISTATPARKPRSYALMPHQSPDVITYVNFWKPTLSIRLVHDFTTYPNSKVIPPEVAPFIKIESTTRTYYPIVYVDYFWLLSHQHIQINTTLTSLPLSLSYSPISQLYWRGTLSMEQSWKLQSDLYGQDEKETEAVKRILIESNPYLLGITMFVSIFHMIFDFLAFKNDITFWKDNKSMTGLSSKSIILNLICQIIIFLYLLDNETTWMIMLSAGIGLLIEFWKVCKAFDVSISQKFPFLSIKEKKIHLNSQGEAETENDKLLLLTQKYDSEAMLYLSYLLYPLVIGYAIYSLFTQTYKGWYSFLLQTLVGCVYTFGFIMMCPQLYLNYKLKSVAALPWRMLTYKFLNTIIDDLFSFLITMPTLHRLSCFRDDIIFLIFLYQKWIYKVDLNRMNEYGLSGNQLKEWEMKQQLLKNSKNNIKNNNNQNNTSNNTGAIINNEHLTNQTIYPTEQIKEKATVELIEAEEEAKKMEEKEENVDLINNERTNNHEEIEGETFSTTGVNSLTQRKKAGEKTSEG